MSLRLKLFQLRPKEKEINIKRIVSLIEEGGFDLGIFPELFVSGYLLRDDINLYRLTEKDIKEIMTHLKDGMTVIFGAPEFDGFLYNSAFILTNENYSTYRKMFLPNFGPFEEKRFFKEGLSPVTFNHGEFRLNVEICYDLFFDEPLVNGSDVIINISASPFTSKTYFERVFPSIAIKKQAFFVYVNTAGLQRNLIFWGGSRVIDPDGNVLIQLPYFKESIGEIEISKETINESRFKRRVLKDELKELRA